MDFPAFKGLCEKRKSVREFSGEPVSESDVLDLLSVAHLAPSVANTQPWRFHVVLSKDLRRDLLDAICYGNDIQNPPVFIVVTCEKAAVPKTERMVWNPIELEHSCMAAMETLLLGAVSKGLCGTWVSLHPGPVQEALSLSRNEIPVGGLLLGHPKDSSENEKKHHDRVPLEDIYTLHS